MRVELYKLVFEQDVARLIENFHKEAVGEYDCQIDPVAVLETIKTADHSNAFLLVIDEVAQGILYGTRLRSPMNGSEIFQEVIWYVNKPFRKYGVYLLRQVEKSLQSQGVSIMIMAVLENSKTEKLKSFYTRLGFRPMESHWMRAL